MVLSVRNSHPRVVDKHLNDPYKGVKYSNNRRSYLAQDVTFFVVSCEDALRTTQLGNPSFCRKTVKCAKSILHVQKKPGAWPSVVVRL